MIEWNELVFYPAGYFTRQIPAAGPADRCPPIGSSAPPSETASTDHAQTHFKRTTLETLIDSPLYAGRYASKLDLDPGAAVPVHMDLFADRPELLAVKPEHLEAYRNLVRQAYKLYGSHHYNHYDFLYSLSDQIQAERPRASSIERGRQRSGVLHQVGQGSIRPGLAAARIHAFVERQIPPPRGSLDAELQRSDAGQPALGL